MQTCQQESVVTQSLIEQIRARVAGADSRAEVVSRLVDALEAANVNLREAPSLDEMKDLLVEAYRTARQT